MYVTHTMVEAAAYNTHDFLISHFNESGIKLVLTTLMVCSHMHGADKSCKDEWDGSIIWSSNILCFVFAFMFCFMNRINDS